MHHIKIGLIIIVTALLNACSPEVCDFNGTNSCEFKSVSDLKITADTIVLVYLSGSYAENIPDPCVPDAKNHGFGVPNVIRETYLGLSKKHNVLLLGYCTPTKTTRFDGSDMSKKPKVIRRSEDIVKLLVALKDSGANPSKVFLTGHSAGGWSSLITQQEHPELARGVIAIAPAFAGTHQGRHDAFVKLRNEQEDRFKASSDMNALIYAFEQDRFENIKTLNFFKRVKGVMVKDIYGHDLQALKCPHRPMHYIPFDDCFNPRAKEMVHYIRTQVQ